MLESLTPAQQIIKIVNEELTALMGGANAKIALASHPPHHRDDGGSPGRGQDHQRRQAGGLLSKSRMGKRPLLVACDVYRPAAITQLQVVGEQLDIPVFAMGQVDPVQIARTLLPTPRTTASTPSSWTPPAGSTSTSS